MKKQILLAMLLGAALAACGRGSSATAPKGWQPMPGPSSAWSSGSGAAAQEYTFTRRPFDGTLQDLASTVTIDVLLHQRGARLGRSTPFGPCPGAAGVATFSVPGSRRLDEGFAVRDGAAIRTSYVRPAGAAEDPNVIDAMKNALCAPPA